MCSYIRCSLLPTPRTCLLPGIGPPAGPASTTLSFVSPVTARQGQSEDFPLPRRIGAGGIGPAPPHVVDLASLGYVATGLQPHLRCEAEVCRYEKSLTILPGRCAATHNAWLGRHIDLAQRNPLQRDLPGWNHARHHISG